jgi:hypothetical protein
MGIGLSVSLQKIETFVWQRQHCSKQCGVLLGRETLREHSIQLVEFRLRHRVRLVPSERLGYKPIVRAKLPLVPGRDSPRRRSARASVPMQAERSSFLFLSAVASRRVPT